MKALEFIRRRRGLIGLELAGTDLFWFFSATSYSLYLGLAPIIKDLVRGQVLDAGAGYLQFKPLLSRFADRYWSLDYGARNGPVDYLTDIQDMQNVPSGYFDTVFCNQVLEHVPSPQKALDEIFRVLKPGGNLIVSVPHLSRLHEEPFDFFRYTQYGLTHLLQKSGYSVIRLLPVGGLLCFLFNQVSTAFLALFWFPRLLRSIALVFNKFVFVVPVVWFDGKVAMGGKFPLNIVAVARKPGK